MVNLIKTINERNDFTDLISKWGGYGFLVGCKNKRNLALAYEFSQIHLNENLGKYYELVDTSVYPCNYRLFNRFEENLPVELIYHNAIKIITELSDAYNEVEKTEMWIKRNENVGVDIEAEFVKKFCDNFSFYYGFE